MSRGARLCKGPKPEVPKEIRIPTSASGNRNGAEILVSVSLLDSFSMDLRGQRIPIAVSFRPYGSPGDPLAISEFRTGLGMASIPAEDYAREDAERLVRNRWRAVGEKQALAKIELEVQRRILNPRAPR